MTDDETRAEEPTIEERAGNPPGWFTCDKCRYTFRDDRYGSHACPPFPKRAPAPPAAPGLKARVLEALAELEHHQWAQWAESLMASEALSSERVERWKRLCATPYRDLTEAEKDQDRAWAKRAIGLLVTLLPGAPPAAPGGVSLTMTQLAIVAFIAHHGVEWNAMEPEDRIRFTREDASWRAAAQAVLAAVRGTGDGRLRAAAEAWRRVYTDRDADLVANIAAADALIAALDATPAERETGEMEALREYLIGIDEDHGDGPITPLDAVKRIVSERAALREVARCAERLADEADDESHDRTPHDVVQKRVRALRAALAKLPKEPT